MITTEQTKQILADFGRKANDSGSPEVQIALLNARMKDLNEHFATHKKDFHSRVGLLKIVSQRKKMLEYLKNKDLSRYKALVLKLGIRK